MGITQEGSNGRASETSGGARWGLGVAGCWSDRGLLWGLAGTATRRRFVLWRKMCACSDGSDSCNPMDCSLFLLQRIFPTQESNRGLLNCRWILYQLSYQGSPVAHQVPLFMGSSRQEYWNGLLFPSPEDLPDPGIKPRLLCLLHWQADSLPLLHLGRLRRET